MSLPSVRPVRLLWLLCACCLLLPISAAAGRSPSPSSASYPSFDVGSLASSGDGAWRATSHPKRLVQTISLYAEDDDFDPAVVRGDVLPRTWSQPIDPPPARGLLAPSRLRGPAPRRAVVSRAFVPRPPPVLTSL